MEHQIKFVSTSAGPKFIRGLLKLMNYHGIPDIIYFFTKYIADQFAKNLIRTIVATMLSVQPDQFSDNITTNISGKKRSKGQFHLPA